MIIFVVSENTPNAEGQQRELRLALENVTSLAGTAKIIPIFISGTNLSYLPEELRNKNGIFLDGHTIKSVALKIASSAFPSLVKKQSEKPWNYPIPGEWLEVSNLDGIVEQHFNIGDKLYFRAHSPMGLLECYAPKIEGLFWIASENVKPSKDIENDTELENNVPRIFTISTMVEMQNYGWQALQSGHTENDEAM